MKRLFISSLMPCCLLVAWPALAAEPSTANDKYRGSIMSPGEVAATPEMWFYEQYQRDYQDPQTMVRKKAEYRTVQNGSVGWRP